MTDLDDRKQESEQTDELLFEREVDDEAARRHAAAERLKNDPLPEPDDA